MLRAILVRELRAVGVPTNNQREQISGPCRLCEGLDKARHVVPTALLVKSAMLKEESVRGSRGAKYKTKRKRSDSVL